MYEVKSEQFNGPLDKLLQLIEEKKLEPTQVSLAAVTADFIRYVEELEKDAGVETSILADFIAVAARLLLIKSKVLLPNLELTQEEKVDIADLEHRLKVYREFKAAGLMLKKMWDLGKVAQARPLLSAVGNQSFFYPPKAVNEHSLHHAVVNLFAVLEHLLPETRTVSIKVVTLQEKITEMTKRLETAMQFSFKGAAKAKDKQEVIVMFLAVLHMLANHLAQVEQGDMFGDIIVSKSQPETESAPTPNPIP